MSILMVCIGVDVDDEIVVSHGFLPGGRVRVVRWKDAQSLFGRLALVRQAPILQRLVHPLPEQPQLELNRLNLQVELFRLEVDLQELVRPGLARWWLVQSELRWWLVVLLGFG
jgi:hypothetical protein